MIDDYKLAAAKCVRLIDQDNIDIVINGGSAVAEVCVVFSGFAHVVSFKFEAFVNVYQFCVIISLCCCSR